MFELADIIKHKTSGQCYLILKKDVYISRNVERIEYTVVQIGAGVGVGVHVRLHYPLMTINYEKIA